MHVEHLVGRRIGQYELTELLGVGAMGAVYRAHQPTLGRDVAVKLLPTELAARTDYAARFNREAKIAAALEHPHIVPLHDYGHEDGISYVVMRLLTGGTLAQRLNQRAVEDDQLPSLSETATLLRQVASALEYAHRKGVVHRDIKPSNIMFDSMGSPYIVDFGIAKLLDVTTSVTGSETIFGTPHYMPPEQWRDEILKPETDQYALGVVIYSMTTGQPPFDAPTPHALMYKHFHEPPPPPQTVRPDLPDELEAVLTRALAKRPEDRFPSVMAFAEAFDRAINGLEPHSTGFFTFPVTLEPVATSAPASMRLPAAPASAAPNARPAPEPGAAPKGAAFAEPVLVPPAPPPPSPYVSPHPTPTPAPRAQGRGMPPVIVGAGLGLALLSIIVCGGVALVASQLGGFERTGLDREALPSRTGEADDALVLTPATEPQADSETPETTRVGQQATDVAAPSVADTQVANPQAAIPTTALTLIPLSTAGAQTLPTDNAATTLPDIATSVTDLPATPLSVAAGAVGETAELVSMAHGTEPVRGVTFSPDGDVVATGAGDGSITLWSLDGTQQARLNSGGGVTYSLAYSPDGRLLVSGHEDATVRVWDVAQEAQIVALSGHVAPIRQVTFSADGRYFASASEDRTVRIWDASDFSTVQTLPALSSRILGVAFSADRRRIATVGDDNIGRIWDVGSGQVLFTVQVEAGAQMRSIAFSPRGDQFATTDTSGVIRLWDATTGEPMGELRGHDGWVWTVTYSPDGTLLASGGRDNTARLWDVATQREVAVLRGHLGWVLSVGFSPDGSTVITGSGDGTARLWSITTGQVVG